MVNYHIRKVAIATNFTPEADNALTHAAVIAKQKNASLAIIHAVSPSASRNKKAEFVSKAYEKLKVYAEKIHQQHGLHVSVFARVGDVSEFIFKYCVDRNIDLLLIGVQTGVKKYLGDTAAYEIIMKVECPVLSIPLRFDRFPFQKILFPVRDVTGVQDKLAYTKPFIDGAAIHMICLGDPGVVRIGALIKSAKNLGIEFNAEDDVKSYSKMQPSHVIDTARAAGDDLIVINATKEREWYNIFGENYTSYILIESDIAVLSITHQFQSGDLP